MFALMPQAARRAAAADDDAALAAQVAARDGAALERLYRREAGAVYRYLLALWHSRPLADDDGAEVADGGLDPEALLVRRQSVEGVHAALARLPWPQREAIVLVDLQQRPYAEAAAIAGAELNTLRTRLHRGRAQLARLLGDGAPR